MRRLPLIFLTALMAATLLPTAAQADGDRRIRVYKVTAEGSGTFEYQASLDTAFEVKRDVAYSWNLQLPSVAFLASGEGFTVGTSAPTGSITGDATEETTIIGEDGHGGTVTTHGYCEAKGATLPAGGATITPDPTTGATSGPGTNLTVKPFNDVRYPANCTAKVYGGKNVLAVDTAPGGFDQRFFLPTEATRQGKIIQLVQASPAQRDKCSPTIGIGTCKFDWHGTLTFEFTGYIGEGELTEDDLPELPPGGGAQPQPQPQQPQPQSDPDTAIDDDLIVPLPSGGKLSRRGDSATLNVRCAGACSGTVSAFVPSRGARASAARPLARAKFRAPAGKAARVRLRFRGAALRKVRKARAVRLVVDTGKAKRTVVLRAR